MLNHLIKKYCYSILIIFSFIFSIASSQPVLANNSDNSNLSNKKIDELINRINSDVKYRIISKDIYNDISSTEKMDQLIALEPKVKSIFRLASTVVKGFLVNSDLRKIRIDFEGDRETLVREFYFKDGELIFSKEEDKLYSPPKWDKKSKISLTKITNYYFNKGKLTLISNKDGHSSFSEEELKQEQDRICSAMKFYEKKLNNGERQ